VFGWFELGLLGATASCSGAVSRHSDEEVQAVCSFKGGATDLAGCFPPSPPANVRRQCKRCLAPPPVTSLG